MNNFLSFWSTNRLTPSMKDPSNRLNHLKVVHDLITWPYLRVRSFGMIRIRISDTRSLGSWQVKWADESTLDHDLSVHLIYHDTNDLGSLILIRIIPKERTLNEATAFCLWDKDKMAMTVRPILLRVSEKVRFSTKTTSMNLKALGGIMERSQRQMPLILSYHHP